LKVLLLIFLLHKIRVEVTVVFEAQLFIIFARGFACP
jgi:hypothetical protein